MENNFLLTDVTTVFKENLPILGRKIWRILCGGSASVSNYDPIARLPEPYGLQTIVIMILHLLTLLCSKFETNPSKNR